MRGVLGLIVIPLLVDAFVAFCLSANSPEIARQAQAGATREHVIFLDWDEMALTGRERHTLALAAAQIAEARISTRIKVVGDVDRAANHDETHALAIERIRRARAASVRDRLTEADIGVTTPASTPGGYSRIDVVFQGGS